MTAPPRLIDRAALERHRARARRTGPALFLQEAAADDLQERLAGVNRRFTAPAIVTPFPEIWSGRGLEARIVADTDLLDLQAGAHDLVIHALALHWADDPVGQLVQCRRALKPDGLFLGASLGGRTLSELRAALAEAEARLTGGLSPRVAPMAEIRDLGALLQRAGFALPVADAWQQRATYGSAWALMADLRAMGESNALAGRLRRATRPSLLRLAAELYGQSYPAPGGRVAASFEIVTLTGWAPHESQQAPLRPGSASARLADALGAVERSAGERPGD